MAFRFRSNLYKGVKRKLTEPCLMVDNAVEITKDELVLRANVVEFQDACTLAGIETEAFLHDPLVKCYLYPRGSGNVYFFSRLEVEYFMVE